MAKETAEQKLLKLIEATESQGKPAQASSAPAASAQEAQKVLQSVSGIGVSSVGLPSFFQNIFALLKGQPKGPMVFGLREINKILLVCIVIVVIFFTTDFMNGMKLSQKEFRFFIGKNIVAAGDSFLPAFRDLKEYVTAMARRNIFQPFEKKVEEQKAAQPAELSSVERVIQQMKDWRLVGISWLDTPDSASAMMENTATGVTYFLKPVDKIQNVTVKNIYSDSIIISFQGQEMEMKL
jgi:hypothetical protein